MGQSRVCEKRPSVSFLPPAQPLVLFERFINRSKLQQPVPSDNGSTKVCRAPFVRIRSASSPAIPVPKDSPLRLKFDRDELEIELSSHYFESRTETMLARLRCSASSIEMDANNWKSTSCFDCDDGSRRDYEELDESGKNTNKIDSKGSASVKRGDEGGDIFALEYSDLLETRRPY